MVEDAMQVNVEDEMHGDRIRTEKHDKNKSLCFVVYISIGQTQIKCFIL